MFYSKNVGIFLFHTINIEAVDFEGDKLLIVYKKHKSEYNVISKKYFSSKIFLINKMKRVLE